MTAELSQAELEAFLGPTGTAEYRGAPEWDQPMIRKWIPELQGMSDEDFVAECASKILDSAMVGSKGFKGNWEGVHARATACYREAKRRHEGAGHAPSCSASTLYSQGMNRARKSQGHAPESLYPCTCGRMAER